MDGVPLGNLFPHPRGCRQGAAYANQHEISEAVIPTIAKADIEEHKHRFAVWAASRAASSINVPFKVEQGKQVPRIFACRGNLRVDSRDPLGGRGCRRRRGWGTRFRQMYRVSLIESG